MNTFNEDHRSHTDIRVMETVINNDFIFNESRLIIVSIISIIITIGALAVIIRDKGENCALNNACFSLISSVLTLYSTIIYQKVSSCKK